MSNLKIRFPALLLISVILLAAFAVSADPSAKKPLTLSIGTTAQTTAQSFKTSEFLPFASVQKAISSFGYYNKDVKAWLLIPNTNINYPVLYSNVDNEYYAKRDWRGVEHTAITWKNWADYGDTAIYLDYRSRIGDSWDNSSRNIVLYGHNWNNLRNDLLIGNYIGYSMFAQLPSFTNLAFARENPHIYYSTGNTEGIWRVFAVAYTEQHQSFYYNKSNPDDQELQHIIDEWRLRSVLNYNVDVNVSDRIITLVTCTRVYGDTEDQRFVVVARLLRPGESENDPVTITLNPNFKKPDFSVFTMPATPTEAPAIVD